MAHYYAERFFAPTLLSAIIAGDMVEVWAVCDAPTSPLTLSTTALSWTSFNPTNTSLVEVAGCPGPGAHLQLEVALADLLSWGGCHPGSYDHQRLAYCLLTFHLQEGAGLPLSTSHLLEAPKALNDPTFGLQEPNLRVTVTGRVNRITEVGPAPWTPRARTWRATGCWWRATTPPSSSGWRRRGCREGSQTMASTW